VVSLSAEIERGVTGTAPDFLTFLAQTEDAFKENASGSASAAKGKGGSHKAADKGMNRRARLENVR